MLTNRKDLIVVACTLLNLSYRNMALSEVLKENNMSLDDLSSDLVSILNNDHDSLLRLRCLEVDFSEYSLIAGQELLPNMLREEFNNLLLNINYRLNQIRIRGTRLVAIQFKEPDNIFFIFV